jgi:hypothetical protein
VLVVFNDGPESGGVGGTEGVLFDVVGVFVTVHEGREEAVKSLKRLCDGRRGVRHTPQTYL